MSFDDIDGKTIKISSLRYKLNLVDSLESDSPDNISLGEIDYVGGTILIKRNIQQDQQLLTLFHEIVHGYDYAWMNCKYKLDGEHLANFVSQIITSVFCDNPWLCDFISKIKTGVDNEQPKL